MRILFLSVALLLCCRAEAQALQYLDDAGNIHYADSIEQVPMQYRKQLGVDPNPPPTDASLKGKKASRKKKRGAANATSAKKKKGAKKGSGKKSKKAGKKGATTSSSGNI